MVTVVEVVYDILRVERESSRSVATCVIAGAAAATPAAARAGRRRRAAVRGRECPARAVRGERRRVPAARAGGQAAALPRDPDPALPADRPRRDPGAVRVRGAAALG